MKRQPGGTSVLWQMNLFSPSIDSQIATFTTLYKYAHITPAYLPEKDLISAFLKDSVKVIATAWQPSEEQKSYYLTQFTDCC